jgi:predicted lipid-binding transport protein (Tim44 family)
MSDTRDLKNLLDRLRSETGPLPQEVPEKNELPAQQHPRQAQNWAKPSGAYRPYRPQEPGAGFAAPSKAPGTYNTAWSENKETMLFGMLASLITALGGILAGLEYLVVAGAAIFSMFSLVMCLTLLRVMFVSTRRAPENSVLEERVDALSKRVETLSSRAVSGGGPAQGGSPARDYELEQKVEELRVLIKSLAKAVEGSNK